MLKGTELADVIVGLGGNDRLTAVPSYYVGDTLEGDAGNDVLLGSVESDALEGGPGADALRGGPGPGRSDLTGSPAVQLVVYRPFVHLTDRQLIRSP